MVEQLTVRNLFLARKVMLNENEVSVDDDAPADNEEFVDGEKLKFN